MRTVGVLQIYPDGPHVILSNLDQRDHVADAVNYTKAMVSGYDAQFRQYVTRQSASTLREKHGKHTWDQAHRGVDGKLPNLVKPANPQCRLQKLLTFEVLQGAYSVNI